MRSDVSQKSCGGGPRRIAHFAKLGHRMDNYVSPAQILRTKQHHFNPYLMPGDTSTVGCGCRVPFVAKSPNRALKPASSRRRLEDSRFWHARRRELCVSGAWRPKPSGMRRRTAPHCAFRKMGPPIGDIHPRALRDTYEGHVHRDRIRSNRAWRHEQSGMRPLTASHCVFAN